MVLIIDNYDSFTYNLVQSLGEIDKQLSIRVVRNDKINIEKIKKINPGHIIISPGPGRPETAGISLEIIEKFCGVYPVLGVCLGHQCIGQALGGEIIRAGQVYHGKPADIFYNEDEKILFKGLSNPFSAARYHSLIIKKSSIPSSLKIIARTAKGEVMAVVHREYPVYGVQFHPESILTKPGKKLLANFLNIADKQ